MTAVEKIIAEINNELQTLESLHGKEIFGRKVGLAFAKRVAEQAKEMEKEQMLKTFTESRTISVECAVWNCQGNERKWESFEQCYNETFKQQEQ